MTAVPFVRREARAKLPPDEPLIPQRRGGTAGYWLYLIPGLVLLTVVVLIPLGLEHLPQLHRVARHQAAGVHRPRELDRALRRRQVLDLVPATASG